MLVPLSWLNDYVDINVSADELEKKLFDCGFEVEEKWQVGKDISGIVVGYVESCEPIPETHLHVCQVNVGGPELLQICCASVDWSCQCIPSMWITFLYISRFPM